jgi:hypothetical protein
MMNDLEQAAAFAQVVSDCRNEPACSANPLSDIDLRADLPLWVE